MAGRKSGIKSLSAVHDFAWYIPPAFTKKMIDIFKARSITCEQFGYVVFAFLKSFFICIVQKRSDFFVYLLFLCVKICRIYTCLSSDNLG